MTIFMGYWWKICKFTSKRGLKGANYLKFHMSGRYGIYNFYFSSNFDAVFFFFELIAMRASNSKWTYFLYLCLSPTKAEFQNLNFLIFYPIFMDFFWQNDHLYGLLIDNKKNFAISFLKGSNSGPNFKITHIWKAYKLVKQN